MKYTLLFVIAAFAVCSLALPARAQTAQVLSITFSDSLVQGTLTVENPSGQVLFTENDLATPDGLPLSLVNDIEADPTNEPLSAYAAANLPSLIGPQDTDFGYIWDGDTTAMSVPGWLPTVPPSQLLSANGSLITGSFSIGGGNGANAEAAVTADLFANDPFSAPVVSDTVTDNVGQDIFTIVHKNDPVFPYVADVAVNYNTVNIVEQEAGIVPEASSLVLLIAGLAGLGLFAWPRRKVRQQ